MHYNSNLDQLIVRVRSLISENGYSFSNQDKLLLEEILAKLEELSKNGGGNPNHKLDLVFLLLKVLQFFGIDDFTKLF